MPITRRNGYLLNPIPELLDDILTRDAFDWGFDNPMQTGTSVPAVNIKETPEHFDVEVAAPGMKKKILKLNLIIMC